MMLSETLASAPRLLIEAKLRPVQGSRFQPTGFADLGPAEFNRPGADDKPIPMLLVESAQSVANRLERAIIGDDGLSPIAELEGLPYVEVTLTGHGEGVRTSSLVEAHRLNSPFIVENGDYKKSFVDRTGYKRGSVISWPKVAAAVFHDDPCSLLHGVFFSNMEDGRLRFPRAITGFIEAEQVERAVSGGVKNNHFDPEGEVRVEKHEKDVYGNVPYARVEFTAQAIRAYFNLDLEQLRSYRLPPEGTELLIALALLKVRRFLDRGLRLRTACDLEVQGDVAVTRPADGFVLPSTAQLLGHAQASLKACREKKDLLASKKIQLTVNTVKKAKAGS